MQPNNSCGYICSGMPPLRGSAVLQHSTTVKICRRRARRWRQVTPPPTEMMRLRSRLDKIYYFTYGHLTVDTLEDKDYAKYMDRVRKHTNIAQAKREKWWHQGLTEEAKRLYLDKRLLVVSMSRYFPLKWKLPYRRRFFNRPTQTEWAQIGKRASYQKNEYRFNLNYKYSKQSKYLHPPRLEYRPRSVRVPKKKKYYKNLRATNSLPLNLL